MMPEHKGYEGQYIDTYRLIHRLGEGAFGEVYLAKHLRDHTHVAVKVLKVQLSSKWLKDFEAEVRVLFRLIHPHIVRLRDFSLISEPPFLVMDYAPGGTLRQRHPSGTLVPLPLVCSYIQQ